MNKTILTLLSFCLFSVLILVYLLFSKSYVDENNPTIGDFVFSQSRDVDAAVLAGKKIYKDKGVWKSSNGYPLDNDKIDVFFLSLQTATLLGELVEEKKFSKQIELLQNAKPVFVAYLSDDNRAILLNNHKYLLSRMVNLPDNLFFEPLLPLEDMQIGTSEVEGLEFSQLIYTNVIKENEAVLSGEKNFKVVTKNGVVINFALFNNNLVSVALSLSALPTKSAAAFVKNNTPLYNGWIFEILPLKGSIVSENN